MATYNRLYQERKDRRLNDLDNYGDYVSEYENELRNARKNYSDLGQYKSAFEKDIRRNKRDIKNYEPFSSEYDAKIRNNVGNIEGHQTYTRKYNDQINNVMNQIADLKPYESPYQNEIDAGRDYIQNYGPYQSRYQEDIDKWTKALTSDYDPTQDSMYDYYRQAYTMGGQQAMQNTLAAAAANSGGYGNTYAQSQGQQAYNQYMTALADKIPELARTAMDMYGMRLDALRGLDATEYQRWNDELANAYNRLDMWTDADNTAYGRSRDARSDLFDVLGMYTDAEKTEYGYWNDELENMYNLGNLYRQLRGDERAEWEYGLENLYRYGDYLMSADANARSNYGTNADYLRSLVDMYTDADNTGYQRWVDGRNFISSDIGLLDNLETSNYNIWEGQEKFNEDIRRWEDEMAYQRERDAIADSQWQAEFDANQANAAADRALREAAAAAAANQQVEANIEYPSYLDRMEQFKDIQRDYINSLDRDDKTKRNQINYDLETPQDHWEYDENGKKRRLRDRNYTL